MKLTYNAPVIMTFTLIAAVLVGIDALLHGTMRTLLAGPPTIAPFSLAWYPNLVTHVVAHRDWTHFAGNATLILLLGPMVEERHGSASLLAMCVITAIATALANAILTPYALIGASGIVFMLILLASFANARAGEVPLTFVIVAVLYIGGEIIASFGRDNISHLAHLIGGACGAAFGFLHANRRPASTPT